MYGKKCRNTTTVSAVADSSITAHRDGGFYSTRIVTEEGIFRKRAIFNLVGIVKRLWSYKGDL